MQKLDRAQHPSGQPEMTGARFANLARWQHPAGNADRHFHAQITMNRISTDLDICHGKPCIRGLRYPVQTVLEWLAGGMTDSEILDDYPDLESDDIYAALTYAAGLAQTNRVELLAA